MNRDYCYKCGGTGWSSTPYEPCSHCNKLAWLVSKLPSVALWMAFGAVYLLVLFLMLWYFGGA